MPIIATLHDTLVLAPVERRTGELSPTPAGYDAVPTRSPDRYVFISGSPSWYPRERNAEAYRAWICEAARLRCEEVSEYWETDEFPSERLDIARRVKTAQRSPGRREP